MAKDKKGINMEQISYYQKADIWSLGTKQENEINGIPINFYLLPRQPIHEYP